MKHLKKLEEQEKEVKYNKKENHNFYEADMDDLDLSDIGGSKIKYLTS